MAPPLLILLTGFLYVLFFEGLSLLRREGLSIRFAIESVCITCGVAALAALTSFSPMPVLFLALLYLVTMRVRLLIDVGNLLARRGNLHGAGIVYDMGLRLWPDEASRLSVQVNLGVLSLQCGDLDRAITRLTQVVGQAASGFLGLKQQCGCHYNLGVAYRRKGQEAQAIAQFNKVLDTWPASEYARYARAALRRDPDTVKHDNM